IQGNVIGLKADGATPLPNTGAGIDIDEADDVHVGGTTAGAGNVIAANDGTGITVANSDRPVLQGNLVGTTTDGVHSAANGGPAQLLLDNVSDALVGGTTAAARNVLAGPGGGPNDVTISGGSGNTLQGNYIGTDATGQVAFGGGEGVVVENSSGNTIG